MEEKELIPPLSEKSTLIIIGRKQSINVQNVTLALDKVDCGGLIHTLDMLLSIHSLWIYISTCWTTLASCEKCENLKGETWYEA